MLYTTIVDKDDTGLLTILRAAEKFDEDRFLEGIHQRCYTAEDIRQAIDRVRAYQARLNVEARSLAIFSQSFLGAYATDNNKCFETAHMLFNRIRSTISASRRVFKKTCPIIRKRQPAALERPSVYVRSVLAGGECNMDIFGLLSYEDSVQTLYSELQAFFTTVITTLALCRYMIKTEQAIREDGDRCACIYKDCERKTISSARELAKFISSVSELPANELAERKAKARSINEFYKENYHQWDTGQFRMSVAVELLRQGRNEGLTDEETRLWPENHARALRVKEAIAAVDRMEGIANKKGKLTGGFIVELIKWAEVPSEMEKSFYLYFCREYKEQDGRYDLPGWSAVSAERKNRREMGIHDKETAASFERRLGALPGSSGTEDARDGRSKYHIPAI